MSSGLQVEKIAVFADVKPFGDISNKEIQTTSKPSVDSERSQRGLLRVGNGYQAVSPAEAHSTLEPGVDSLRSQGGPFIRGTELVAGDQVTSSPLGSEKVGMQKDSEGDEAKESRLGSELEEKNSESRSPRTQYQVPVKQEAATQTH
jgi:hypothetical protein